MEVITYRRLDNYTHEFIWRVAKRILKKIFRVLKKLCEYYNKIYLNTMMSKLSLLQVAGIEKLQL